MTLLNKSLKLALAALLVASCGGANPIAAKPTDDPLAGTFVTKGGGGALDNVRALTNAFSAAHPAVLWQGFDDVGSDAGVSLTISSTVDLGFISRPLKPAEEGKVEIVPIGASGTGVGINASNPVKALTKDQVAKIFTGQITDWKDVGGTPGPIRVLLREPESSTRSAFEQFFFGTTTKPVYAKNAVEVFQIDETLKALGSFKDSIGMMTMNAKAFSTADVWMVTIDNIAATKENLSNNTYPILRRLFFVYNTEPAKVKPTIKAFIDFVKGPEGQKILAGL